MSPEEYLKQRLPELLVDGPAVRAVVELATDVWRVEFADGRRLVAKYQLFGSVAEGTGHDLLMVERRVLDLLGGAGCAVPLFLGSDPAAQFIFLEYCGDATLDDVVQEDENARAWVERAIGEFWRIDAVFRERQAGLTGLVAPGAGVEELIASWKMAVQGAARGLAEFLEGERLAEGRRLLAEMGQRLMDLPPALGSTDFNARNVVVDREKGELRFIEFAKIGWDWSERRLTQYVGSLGSGRKKGNFRDLLVEDRARRLAGEGGDLAALDGHRMIFWLNAAGLLTKSREQMDRVENELSALWRNSERRLERLRGLLREPLGSDPLCVALSRLFV